MMVRTKPIEESIRVVVQSEQGFKASDAFWLRETEWKTVVPLLPWSG